MTQMCILVPIQSLLHFRTEAWPEGTHQKAMPASTVVGKHSFTFGISSPAQKDYSEASQKKVEGKSKQQQLSPYLPLKKKTAFITLTWRYQSAENTRQ